MVYNGKSEEKKILLCAEQLGKSARNGYRRGNDDEGGISGGAGKTVLSATGSIL